LVIYGLKKLKKCCVLVEGKLDKAGFFFFRTLPIEFNKDNSLMALEAVLVTERQAVV
jgi:hypothetical protein